MKKGKDDIELDEEEILKNIHLILCLGRGMNVKDYPSREIPKQEMEYVM